MSDEYIRLIITKKPLFLSSPNDIFNKMSCESFKKQLINNIFLIEIIELLN